MPIFKVGSVFIKADKLPERFDGFILQENITPDTSIVFRQVYKAHSLDGARKLVDLQQFDIWESNEYEEAWIYRLKVNAGTMLVARDYSKAEYYINKEISAGINIMDILEPLFRMTIQCRLIQEGFIILHAACVCIKDDAFAFSGVSGIGKSTRARRWVEDLAAEWISGDRPIIDPNNGVVYGAPWDGKEHIFNNTSKQLKCILQVNRSEEAYLKEMSFMDKYRFLANQIFIPLWDSKLTAKVFDSLKQLLANIKMYSVFCDQTYESTNTIYRLLQDMN